jgi:serine/threonine-protein kinase
MSLMVMDLDHFKEINDNHGHHVGDRALVEIARVLRAGIRPYDILVGLVQRMVGHRAATGAPVAAAGAEAGDRYTITREVGRGSVATVYLAHDRKHDREVALKVLKPEIALGADRRRFEREIAILARLHHPHILQLYDSGVLALPDEREGLFYVMPYVRGETLRLRLERESRLPPSDAVHISCNVADALRYAHAQGIIHRDIRPENILLESGHALVADFGIARALEASGGEQISTWGMVLGHPAYMSPEQARGSAKLDGRSDIYSLGIVLYEMLAGMPPFTGATPAAVLARQVSDQAPSLETVCPDLPRYLVQAVTKAMAKRATDRYPDAGALMDALRG